MSDIEELLEIRLQKRRLLTEIQQQLAELTHERDEARAVARSLFGGDNMTWATEARYLAAHPWLRDEEGE
jgi:hypothetical protein